MGDNGFIWAALIWFLMPTFVMLAWGFWHAIRQNSPMALFKTVFAATMFSVLAGIPWFLGTVIPAGLIAWVLGSLGAPQLLVSIVGFAFLGACVVIGAPLSWRWISREMPSDTREWRI